MLQATYNQNNGVVTTIASGLASRKEFDAYVQALAPLLAISRTRHGGSLHLVDAVESPVQAGDQFDHMVSVSTGTIFERDRCAILLNSMLVRLQIRRMPIVFARQFFDSRDIATQWLLDQARIFSSDAGGK